MHSPKRGSGFIAIVGAVLLMFTVSGWWIQRSSEFDAANQSARADGALVAQQFMSEFNGYLGALEDVSAFVSSSPEFPTPEAFDRYLANSGFFEDNPGYNDLGVAQLVTGQDQLDALIEREQSFDPAFRVLSLDAGESDDSYMVLTRTSTESITSGFGGLDLYTALGVNVDVKEVVFDERLGASDIDLTGSIQNEQGMLDRLDENGFTDLTTVFVYPILRDGETIGVILARGIAGPTLESVLGKAPDDVALELLRDGKVVASTTSLIPDGFTTSSESFTTGSLSWTVRSYAPVQPNHTSSTVVLLIGLILTLAALLIVRFGTANAVTAGQLRRSRFEARHDPLTGLPNRVAAGEVLAELLTAERQPGTKIAVLFCDLDRLRVVNDSIGHSAGDESLRVVAAIIATTKRDDDFLSRFSGDEFAILCSVQSAEEAVAIGERIIAALEAPIQLSSGATPVLTASIGVAIEGPEAETAENLLRDAELAMYRAKDAGRATVSLFANELRTNAVKRLQIEQDLRHAVTAGEIVVYFQPLVRACDHTIDGFEALVRWQHPERGLISPGEFLPVAEESGLIVQLGQLVVTQAIRQVAEWNEQTGNSYRIAVNLSSRELASSDVVHTMAQALAVSSFPPHLLELEISEDLLLTGARKQLEILRDLRALGVALSIDDFGTGRASLGQLRSLDMVSTLKIDQSFVRNMHLNEKDRSIIGAIVELAKAVGMATVAEGVEQPEHAHVLAELGVDLLQGFAFARPARAEMIAPLLHRGPLIPYAVS